MKRCNKKGCGSYAFNLRRDGIDQGELCDVHYWQNIAERLRAAICKTLDENSHLADGECCMLLALKVALRESGTPWDGDEE